MSHSFYRAFEDRHRGSRTLIKSRLAAYLPFLQPLAAAGARPAALDLGCGRGEWLELLTENGFAARGVDLDAGMLEACRELGLDAEIGDALGALRAVPDASLALISAFHLVEHIAFDAVQELIGEALRVLQPGGLLIMETPNPENLVVGTSGFYMDPSHLNPIPPLLLDFVVGYAGFERHKVVRLQEPAQLHGEVRIELVNVLDGVSPDYSVVAQKSAPPDLMALHDAAFAAEFGLRLGQLAARYDAQRDQALQALEGGVAALSERSDSAQRDLAGGLQALRSETAAIREELARLRETEERALRTEQALEAVRLRGEQQLEEVRLRGEQQLEEVRLRVTLQLEEARSQGSLHVEEVRSFGAQQLEAVRREAAQQLEQTRAAAVTMEEHLNWKLNVMTARAEAAERKVGELYASTSWRVTRPARAMVSLIRSPRRLPEYLRRIRLGMKSRARGLTVRVVRKAVSNPRIRGFAMRTLARFPALDRKARALAVRILHARPPAAAAAPGAAPAAAAPGPAGQAPQAPAQLSRSAQKIFTELTLPPQDDTTPF